jgi:hypothetical protein
LIDAATLEFYLATLEAELAEHHDQVITGDPPWVYRCLKLVANIHRPDLLKVIEARANTSLERQISAIAQSRLRQSGFTVDPVFDMARTILCKIGGQELTQLINSELGSHDSQMRDLGMKDAVRRPDDRTRALLRGIAQSDERRGSPLRPVEQPRAIEVLAALGDEDAVVHGVLRWGQHVSRSIWSYWNTQRPMEIASLRDILHGLVGKDGANVDNALIAAGISGNPECIPAVRQVLREASPESKTAWCAASALRELGDKSEEFVELLIRLLAAFENRSWAMQWLPRIWSSRALDPPLAIELLHCKRTTSIRICWDTVLSPWLPRELCRCYRGRAKGHQRGEPLWTPPRDQRSRGQSINS